MSPTHTQRPPLDLGILGTRGIPANYGGFETFAEQLSVRLVQRGHRVTVYSRSGSVDSTLRSFQGVQICVLPAWRHKYLETVSHTALSALRALTSGHDGILLCNAANAFLAWIPQLAGQKVVLNVDGLERFRRKWNLLGRLFYRLGEFLATQLPDAAVSDARCIQRYYEQEYGAATRFIAYGAPAGGVASTAVLETLGLEPSAYILYVSRLEPENNALLVMQAYLSASLTLPLVIVGDAPYSDRYKEQLRRLAGRGNIHLPGAIYGRGYRELLSHCLCYVHATEVGGTHPALIEAMGAGCTVVVNDTPENREVVEDAGLFYAFNDLESLAARLKSVSERPQDFAFLGNRALDRVQEHYQWGLVVEQYENLFYELIQP